jgi:hypothetical protein
VGLGERRAEAGALVIDGVGGHGCVADAMTAVGDVVVARQDQKDAWRARRLIDADRGNAGVCVWRTHKCRIRLAWHGEIIGVLALAAEETRILQASEWATDVRVGHVV